MKIQKKTTWKSSKIDLKIKWKSDWKFGLIAQRQEKKSWRDERDKQQK